MKSYGFIILFFSMTVVICWSMARSTKNGEADCLNCHESIYSKALQNRYIHSTFFEKKCFQCHVENNFQFFSNRAKHGSRKNSRIVWLENHHEPSKIHYFVINSRKIGSRLYIKTTGKRYNLNITSIDLPPIEQTQKAYNDGLKPEITDIYFHGIRMGVISSATVSWQTDKPTNGQLFYEVEKVNLKTRLDPQFKTDHRLDISPLKLNKTYTYKIVSQDIHGNVSTSLPMSFFTAKSSIVNSEEKKKKNSHSSKENLQYMIQSFGNDYFLTVATTRETFMNIGRDRDISNTSNRFAKGKTTPPDEHKPMKNPAAINIAVCMDCHIEYQTEANHPINVRPKRGMRFPKDLPVLDNGKMHCMTCHTPHSSNNEARIRRTTKQNLCLGCHEDYA